MEEWRGRFRGGEIEPICPRVRRVDDELKLVMPGEPHYEELEIDD